MRVLSDGQAAKTEFGIHKNSFGTPMTIFGPKAVLNYANIDEVVSAVNIRNQAKRDYSQRASNALASKESKKYWKCRYSIAQEKVRELYKTKQLYAISGNADAPGEVVASPVGKGVQNYGWVCYQVSVEQAQELGYDLSEPIKFYSPPEKLTPDNIRNFIFTFAEYLLKRSRFCKEYKKEMWEHQQAELMRARKDYDVDKSILELTYAKKENAKSHWVKKNFNVYKQEQISQGLSSEGRQKIATYMKQILLMRLGLFDIFLDGRQVGDVDWDTEFTVFIDTVQRLASTEYESDDQEWERLQAYAFKAGKLKEGRALKQKISKDTEFFTRARGISRLSQEQIQALEQGGDLERWESFIQTKKDYEEINAYELLRAELASKPELAKNIEMAVERLEIIRKERTIAAVLARNPAVAKELKKEYVRLDFLIQKEKVEEVLLSTGFFCKLE